MELSKTATLARILALAVAASPIVTTGNAVAAETSGCVDADPTLELGGVDGDFEIVADTLAPTGHLIFIAHAADGLSSVVAARFNGLTGRAITGSRTTIANNFYGDGVINGPDFVQKPTGELGVVYPGPDGVYGVFRPATSSAWNNFRFDVDGAKISGSPPALANTSPGAYPKGGIPLGQYTYGQKLGACQGICYGALDGRVATDVVAVAAARGLTAFASTQSPRDGFVYLSACRTANSCGMYEALIDDAGGFVAGTFQKLASTDAAHDHMVAARHPVTGSTVIYSKEGERREAAVAVWEQPAEGGALTLLGRVTEARGGHYRAEASTTEIVLHYQVFENADQGSYTIPVTANGADLVVGQNKKVSDVGPGSELAWLPAANQWALFVRSGPSRTLKRCWIAP